MAKFDPRFDLSFRIFDKNKSFLLKVESCRTTQNLFRTRMSQQILLPTNQFFDLRTQKMTLKNLFRVTMSPRCITKMTLFRMNSHNPRISGEAIQVRLHFSTQKFYDAESGRFVNPSGPTVSSYQFPHRRILHKNRVFTHRFCGRNDDGAPIDHQGIRQRKTK
jgi:hypothetical protein